MWYAVKRLALGFVLVVAAAAVLLLSDLGHRKPRAVALRRVAIFQYTSRPLLDEAVRGTIDGLAAREFTDGRTVTIQRFNAEGDLPTANSIAKGITDGRFDLVVTVSTPCLQAMAGANREGKLIHVFGAVTDPFGAGVGIKRGEPLSHPRHLVGIGTFQPVEEIFRLAKECYPGLKTVGNVWCPAEACSEACTVLARRVCKELGIELVEAQVNSSAEVLEAARSLVSRNVEAFWVGGDNVVEVSIGSIVRAAREAGIPVFANTPSHTSVGALIGLGAEYYEVGRITGDLAGQVLQGLDPARVPVENRVPLDLVLNLTAIAGLHAPWRIPAEVRARARTVVDSPAAAGAEPAAPRQDQAAERRIGRARVIFLGYTESSMLTDCYRGFTDELSRAGLTPDQGLELKAMNAQGDMATLVSMVTAAAAARPDLLAVTSTPTLQAAVKVANDLPILFTVVANPVLAGAGKSLTDHLANVTGVSTMSDYQGMAQVLKECLPAAKRVGTLFATSEDNSIYNKDSMAAALRAVGVELVAVGTATPAEIADAALSLMGKDVEAICQVNSNMHDAGFAAIGQAAHKARKPLFGFTTGQVRKGGAAVGVCRDYEQAGRDMARLAVRVLAGESPAAIPIQVVSKTRILVNPKSAELCGLTIPPSLLQRAEVVSGD